MKRVTLSCTMREIAIIAHDIRSCHNVGSLIRTADGLGIQQVFLTGYTPYPEILNDTRLPHIRIKASKDIHKTALGAEDSVNWQHEPSITDVIVYLRQNGYKIVGIEQTKDSISLPTYKPPEKFALVLGREVEGMDAEVLSLCDSFLEIPMYGIKESFNVTQAAAIVLYHCRFAL